MAPNDTPANRALNRRVELTIVQGEDLEQTEIRLIPADTAQASGSTDDINTEVMQEMPGETNPFVEEGDPVATKSVVKFDDTRMNKDDE